MIILSTSSLSFFTDCLFENTNFLGGGLPESDGGQGVETADVDDCDRECKKRDKCNYFTFVGEWKINCYLKARLGENSEFDGATSGTYGQLCGKIIFFHCCSAKLQFISILDLDSASSPSIDSPAAISNAPATGNAPDGGGKNNCI